MRISYRSLAKEAAAEAAAGTPYTLTLINESAAPWTFYVYQKLPKLNPSIFSVAWFASPFVLIPGNQIEFEWEVTYNFVWGANGNVRAGVSFSANGKIAAYPERENTTTFSARPGPFLSPAVKEDPSGSLVIHDADDVPNNTFSVGIGMSGTGTFVAQAGPNLQHIFTPTPSYWVAAGDEVKVGTVLDIKTVTHTAEVIYDINQYDRTLTLDKSNKWI